MKSLLIKNAQIVNADSTIHGDIRIENGKIKEIAPNLHASGSSVQTIDAKGMYVMPGGIDPHTHFEQEFMGAKGADDFYTGSKAAIAGGTTMFIDFVMPKQKESLVDCYKKYRNSADKKVCCDYGLHVVASWYAESIKDEIRTLAKNCGVNSFKMFMAYEMMLNDSQLYQLLEVCKEVGALPMIHAENGVVAEENARKIFDKGITGPEGHELSRPEEIEAEAVFRICTIANQVGCPLYVVHVMSESAAKVIEKFRCKKKTIFGETLSSAIGVVWQPEKFNTFEEKVKFIMAPPIRPKQSTPTSLLNFLSKDVLSLVGSDNCTFSIDQKCLGKDDFRKIPCGINGIEDRMSIIWEKGVNSGILTPNRFVAVASTNAAKLFNLYPQKGCIAVGSDADIVIWNPNKTKIISAKTHHQAVETNIFEGTEVRGLPEYVIVKGKVCFSDNQLKIEKGFGKFIPCPTFADTVYGN